jgi:hypothetical protein
MLLMSTVSNRASKKPATLTLTITLTPENSESLLDYEFWTGLSAERILNRALADHMEMGYGSSLLEEIARDPRRRAAAFRRNNMSNEQIANWNVAAATEFEKLCRESEEDNRRVLGIDDRGKNRSRLKRAS